MTFSSFSRSFGSAVALSCAALVACSRASEEELDIFRRIPPSSYSPGVGASCIPNDEIDVHFAGFAPSEVTLETVGGKNVGRCGTATHCLVDHFQGRVSCPYGQTEATAEICSDPEACRPGTDLFDSSCRVPDADTARADSRILVAVAPQLVSRKAQDRVYCTCACGGSDPDCACPIGFSCRELASSGSSFCFKSDVPSDSAEVCELGVSDERGGCGGDGKNP